MENRTDNSLLTSDETKAASGVLPDNPVFLTSGQSLYRASTMPYMLAMLPPDTDKHKEHLENNAHHNTLRTRVFKATYTLALLICQRFKFAFIN